ncbi:hypothetical protein [Nitrosomonas oligotropha]|uniref:hypothetical protein n=1 Tax=Nitrosomonas oligotropha TaxID=42354 RepID=UPI00136DF687|nr:hypothetical protein [Nitrosomonas oligotropha]MXS84167.1 hypothetical protein [Nitrosomonas oligotropha]
MSCVTLSRIVIIQSLPEDEDGSQTGRQLRDAIEPTANHNHKISVELIDAASSEKFWAALSKVQTSAESYGNRPVVHIECHGLSDKTGISLGDRTPVSWGELKIPLIKLNHATRCNLLVTLAACYGAGLFETLDVTGRAPCWGLIGPSSIVNPQDLVTYYSRFFIELLGSGDVANAVSKCLNSGEKDSKYFLFTAEKMFDMVFQKYRATQSQNAEMIKRAERFSQVFKNHGMPYSNDSECTNLLYEMEKDILERFFKKYFFADCFPENWERFKDVYDAIDFR